MKRPLRVQRLSGIGVDQAGSQADGLADPDILRLENLDTDLAPPEIALRQTEQSIRSESNNSYLPFIGQSRLRNAAAAHVSRISGVPYDGDRNVIISAGGLSGILNVLLAIVENGDEVILTDTTYVGLINRVVTAGGNPKTVPFVAVNGEWRLDHDALASAVTPKTRAMLLMSPSMPSGAYLDRSDWMRIAQLADQHDLWIIYDAAMERILYDGRTVIHPASLPGMASRVITVGAASKELRMIGWRVGWIVAPAELMSDLSLISMANVVVPVGIAQDAVASALEAGDTEVTPAVAEWERRRNVLLNELAGLPLVPPAGGWSLLIDGRPLRLDGKEMAERLFFRAKIAATPMTGWGPSGVNFLRLVYSNEPVARLAGIGNRITSALRP